MVIQKPISRQPIPSEAELVFKGIRFDIYQWRQKMFDGSIETFEKVKRADTVNVIPVTKNGKIIVSEQEQPGIDKFIGGIGGIIDKNEDPLTAAKRELSEETGYAATEILFWFAVQPFEKIEWSIYTFIAKGCQKIKNQKLDSGEKIRLKFVNFDEYVLLTKADNYRDTEIALKFHRLEDNPRELVKVKKLFSV